MKKTVAAACALGSLLAAGWLSADDATATLPTGSPADPDGSVAALDQRMSELEAETKGDRAELSRLEAEAPPVHARLVEHGRSYYRLTRAGLLPIGGGFGALVSYAMHVERARRVLAVDLRDEQQIHRRAAELATEVERLERDRAALAAQRQALAAERSAAEEDQRRRLAFDRAFETSTGAGDEYVAVYGGSASGTPEMPAGGFASARGRLFFPVSSRSDVQPAQRDGTTGPGIEIRAPAGSPVRAVFAARVAFADRYGPYGRIVILDHGDHYYTVSGHLDSIDVKIGQYVAAGDRIGTVGADSAGPMLYFEVRHGSRAVPPSSWLGL